MPEKKYQDEIDFREVLRSPSRWKGAIFIIVIALIITGGEIYLKNIDKIFENRIPPRIGPDTLMFNEIEMMKGVHTPGQNIEDLAKPTPEIIEKGKQLYASTCASCHGAEGKGDGTAGTSLNPKPRNFHSKEGWKNGMELSNLFRTVNDGIQGSSMVAYEYIPFTDRFAMIHYIRSLAPDYPAPTPAELAKMEQTYRFSEGTTTPNKIPVSIAIENLATESKKDVDTISSVFAKLSMDSTSEAITLINKIASDKKTLLNSLNNIKPSNWNHDYFSEFLISASRENGLKPAASNLKPEQIRKLYDYFSQNGYYLSRQ
ncbi:MAG: putative Cytochrome c subfamily [Ignavibacteria bacterium]|nr:putative Cytochrome c subfamily [Ignavibacteria bacterium]